MIDMNGNNNFTTENAEPELVINGEPGVIGIEKHENIALGILGAFLFSLVGGLVFFGLYQIGIIAGFAGLLTVFLSNLGYGLFSGVKNTIRGIIFAIIFTVIAIIAAEYFSITLAIYESWKEFGVTFIECLTYTPSTVIEIPELLSGVIRDLAISLVFTAIASFGLISNHIKLAKAKKN